MATKFLADNNLGSEMLNQVVDFLLRNTGGASNQISYAPQHDPYHQSLPSESSNDERLVREVNVSGIIKKLEEFAKVEEKDNDTVALLVRELNKERPQLTMIESVVDMLNRWSIEHRFPRKILILFIIRWIYTCLLFSLRCYTSNLITTSSIS